MSMFTVIRALASLAFVCISALLLVSHLFGRTKETSLLAKPEDGNPSAAPVELDLVGGGGGMKAILVMIGVLLLIHVANLFKPAIKIIRAGAASGATITLILYCAGYTAVEILRFAIEESMDLFVDYRGIRKKNLWNVIWADTKLVIGTIFAGKFGKVVVRPVKGVLGNEKMGAFIDKTVPVWPPSFWLITALGETFNQLLRCKDGLFQRMAFKNEITKLADDPGPTGLAIQKSCGISGVFDERDGETDGSFTDSGRTPADVPKMYWNADPDKTLVVDVWDDPAKHSWLSRLRLTNFWKMICGGVCPQSGQHPWEFNGTNLIQVEMEGHKDKSLSDITLEFDAPAGKKVKVIMVGFMAGIPVLEKRGWLTGEALELAKTIEHSYREIEASARSYDEVWMFTKALLIKHGLYAFQTRLSSSTPAGSANADKT